MGPRQPSCECLHPIRSSYDVAGLIVRTSATLIFLIQVMGHPLSENSFSIRTGGKSRYSV